MKRTIPRVALAGLLLAVTACASCEGSTEPAVTGPARTYRMGFSAIPPRASESDLLAALDMWTRRGDAAIMHVSVPYKALLSGTSATTYVNAQDLPLANYFRAKHLQLVVTLDVTDGLNRAAEAPELVELGRSIAEPAVQAAYRQYAQAISSTVRPEYLGLAAETNLIRAAAPPSLYAALKQMVTAAAADLQAAVTPSTLYVSVQADYAWGGLVPGSSYTGVEQDFADFPFMRAVGISSYPYFVYADPDDVPLNYYARLLNGRTLPVLVVEGGWSSGAAGAIASSPVTQARYLRRQAMLLDSVKAKAVFQLTFTDLDLSAVNLPPGSILPLFAQLGLVNASLQPKPALAVWDSLFALRRTP